MQIALGCNVTGDLHLPDRGGPGTSSSTSTTPGGDGGGGTIIGGGGDGGIGPGGEGGVGGGGDGGAPGDAAVGVDAESLCPINPCTGGNVCCYVVKSSNSGAFECMPSCPNGAAPNECAGPQQCGGATPVCCAKVQLGPGNVPNCAIDGTSSSCTTSCTTDLGLGCNVTDTLHLCHTNADCASDPNNPYCCTYNGAGVSSVVCVSGLVKNALHLPCSAN